MQDAKVSTTEVKTKMKDLLSTSFSGAPFHRDSAGCKNVSGMPQCPFLFLVSVFGNYHKQTGGCHHIPITKSYGSMPSCGLGNACLDLRNRLQAQQVAIVAETLHAHARKMPTLKKHRLNLRHSPTERTVGGNYCIAFRQTQGPEQRQQAPAMVTA